MLAEKGYAYPWRLVTMFLLAVSFSIFFGSCESTAKREIDEAAQRIVRAVLFGDIQKIRELATPRFRKIVESDEDLTAKALFGAVLPSISLGPLSLQEGAPDIEVEPVVQRWTGEGGKKRIEIVRVPVTTRRGATETSGYIDVWLVNLSSEWRVEDVREAKSRDQDPNDSSPIIKPSKFFLFHPPGAK